jgi:hypothetical protein
MTEETPELVPTPWAHRIAEVAESPEKDDSCPRDDRSGAVSPGARGAQVA